VIFRKINHDINISRSSKRLFILDATPHEVSLTQFAYALSISFLFFILINLGISFGRY